MRLTRRRIAAFLLAPFLPGIGAAAARQDPLATATPTPVSNFPTLTPTEPATATPEPTATVTATSEPTATSTPVPTSTATPAPTATVTATPEPTATATATPEPTATSTPEPTATATPSPTATVTPSPTAGPGEPVPVDRVHVAWYTIRRTGSVPYQAMAYRPRQFGVGLVMPDPTWGEYTITDPAGYAGYDVLHTPSAGSLRADTNEDWLTVGLHRPARVGVVWRGGTPLPPWLAGWSSGERIGVTSARWGTQTYATYWADVGAGDLTLGAVHAGVGGVPWDTYWVLLAEAGGAPSGNPMPGQAPNAPCGWHPDGYHHQIDPVSWCYHGHEHGTDPANLGVNWTPTFGRATAAAGLSEPNAGFKGVGWIAGGVRWYVGMHQGTAGAARLCVQHHETALAAWDDATGELLCDLRWLGDYGPAVRNNPPDLCIERPECPDQCADAAGSHGIRQISVVADGGNGYEPWRVDTAGTVLGLVWTMLFNTTDPVTKCDQVAPCTLVPSGERGSRRFFQGSSFGIVNPPVVGEFWTDPYAMAFRSPSDPDAVRQYLAPHVTHLQVPNNKTWDVEGFGRLGTPSQGDLPVDPAERENSITGAN